MGFPAEASPNVEPRKNNSNKLDSFLSLLTWGNYLLTPEKPNRRTMESPKTPSSTYSMLAQKGRKGYSGLLFSPFSRSGDKLTVPLDEPTQDHLPNSLYNEKFYSEEQFPGDCSNNRSIFENSSNGQEFTDKERNFWNYRVLFPPEELPHSPNNRCDHVDFTNIY